jgi:hypothetical protein
MPSVTANRIDESVELRMPCAVAMVRDWSALPENELTDPADSGEARERGELSPAPR